MEKHFTFYHDTYKDPVIQYSTDDVDYHEAVGNDLALVTWSDEKVYVIKGDIKTILKESKEAYFGEWYEDHGFKVPKDIEDLKAYCNDTELDCDSAYGFALVNIKDREVLAQPYNSNIYFH